MLEKVRRMGGRGRMDGGILREGGGGSCPWRSCFRLNLDRKGGRCFCIMFKYGWLHGLISLVRCPGVRNGNDVMFACFDGHSVCEIYLYHLFWSDFVLDSSTPIHY